MQIKFHLLAEVPASEFICKLNESNVAIKNFKDWKNKIYICNKVR